MILISHSQLCHRHLGFVSDVRETSFHGLHFTDQLLQAQLKGNIVPQNEQLF